jgi:hypothetical protein
MSLSKTSHSLTQAFSGDSSSPYPRYDFAQVLADWRLGDAAQMQSVSAVFEMVRLPQQMRSKVLMAVRKRASQLQICFSYEQYQDSPIFQVDMQVGVGNSAEGLRFFDKLPVAEAILKQKAGPDPIRDYFPLNGHEIGGCVSIGAVFTSVEFRKLRGSGVLHLGGNDTRKSRAHVKVHFFFSLFSFFFPFR